MDVKAGGRGGLPTAPEAFRAPPVWSRPAPASVPQWMRPAARPGFIRRGENVGTVSPSPTLALSLVDGAGLGAATVR